MYNYLNLPYSDTAMELVILLLRKQHQKHNRVGQVVREGCIGLPILRMIFPYFLLCQCLGLANILTELCENCEIDRIPSIDRELETLHSN